MSVAEMQKIPCCHKGFDWFCGMRDVVGGVGFICGLGGVGFYFMGKKSK